MCPHLGSHTRIDVSDVIFQRSRSGHPGNNRLLGGGMEALPANLLPVPTDDTTVRSHCGRPRWCIHCAFSPWSRFGFLGRMSSVDNENPAEDGLGEL